MRGWCDTTIHIVNKISYISILSGYEHIVDVFECLMDGWGVILEECCHGYQVRGLKTMINYDQSWECSASNTMEAGAGRGRTLWVICSENNKPYGLIYLSHIQNKIKWGILTHHILLGMLEKEYKYCRTETQLSKNHIQDIIYQVMISENRNKSRSLYLRH